MTTSQADVYPRTALKRIVWSAQLLMDSLGGTGLTLMVACLSPAATHAEETMRTLSYATRARNIAIAPSTRMDPRERVRYQI